MIIITTMDELPKGCYECPLCHETYCMAMTVRLRMFLQQHITEQHKAVFRGAYFNAPSDFDPDTILDFVDYGIIEKEELIDKDVLPEWWRD